MSPLPAPLPAPAHITVLKAGLLSSVQDLGRRARASGVPSGGALDISALRLANALVGNPSSAAALEVTLLGPTLRFETAAQVALCGAPFAAQLTVDGSKQSFAMWRAVNVPAGSVLSIGGAAVGARAILAVRGGLDGKALFGSVSAERRAGFGGHLGGGQPLSAGDVLTWQTQPPLSLPKAFISPELWPRLGAVRDLRVTVTPEGKAMPASLAALLSQIFSVSPQADRMGLRLNESIPVVSDASRLSLPNTVGALQLPPNGQPMVLLADAGTHGGYPQPLVVIRADLGRLAQLRSGDQVRFVKVTPGQAVAALRLQQQHLRQAETALAWHYGQ